MKMFTKQGLKKFGFRWLTVNIVFLLVKLTIEQDGESDEFFDSTSLFHYISAFFLFMITWEYNDWLLKRQHKRGGLDLKSSLRILGITMSLFIPVAAMVYYLAHFHLKDLFGIECDDPVLEFWGDFLRAVLLCTTVIFFNLFYHSMNQRDEMKKQMEDLKKEMMASKYTSLKNQISPHFLFNSLNTLTSLMYEDRDLASDFVTRLASSYRYILDNREKDLVTLDKELSFLDAFVFMMNVRHKEAVIIKTNIKVDSKEYLIPTLSLQMLVENALKHNYYSKEKPLEINIVSMGDGTLVVRNTLRKRKLKEETTKLGLKNIKKRYSYYSEIPVLIKEEDTSFEVIIPLLNNEPKEMNLISIS